MNRLPITALAAVLLGSSLAGCGASAHSTTSVAVVRTAVDKSAAAQLPQAIRDRGVLVVGTDPTYAPMSSYAADGRTIVGMEPDLAKAIGDVLGLRVRMRAVHFDTILDQAGSGGFDIAMSAMTDTQERAKQVDFVDYFLTGSAILVQRGNPQHITSLRDLCGHRVAVETDTVQVDLLQSEQSLCGSSPIQTHAFASNADALLWLRTGRVDAVPSDMPPAALLANGKRTKAFFQLASDRQYDPGPYGLVVAKNDPALRSAIAAALQRLIHDGTYQHILQHWNLQAGAVKQVQVNSGR